MILLYFNDHIYLYFVVNKYVTRVFYYIFQANKFLNEE